MCGLLFESSAIETRPPTSPLVSALMLDHEEVSGKEVDVHEEAHTR